MNAEKGRDVSAVPDHCIAKICGGEDAGGRGNVSDAVDRGTKVSERVNTETGRVDISDIGDRDAVGVRLGINAATIAGGDVAAVRDGDGVAIAGMGVSVNAIKICSDCAAAGDVDVDDAEKANCGCVDAETASRADVAGVG
ncbi:hypothetical protein [Bradyrhizobium sp. S3.14.4]